MIGCLFEWWLLCNSLKRGRFRGGSGAESSAESSRRFQQQFETLKPNELAMITNAPIFQMIPATTTTTTTTATTIWKWRPVANKGIFSLSFCSERNQWFRMLITRHNYWSPAGSLLLTCRLNNSNNSSSNNEESDVVCFHSILRPLLPLFWFIRLNCVTESALNRTFNCRKSWIHRDLGLQIRQLRVSP